ncbi:MAG TPA: transposase [Thermoleophilaceae bacterium]|nr:transposase [Thermoleophilaceae bacterium]
MDVPKVPPRSAVSELRSLLDSPEIQALVGELEATRWTGRPGYAIRVMVGVALVKSMYALPTWSRTVRLVSEHAALRDVLGAVPSQWACYRFTAKLREHSATLAACLDSVTAGLHKLMPGLGENVALDGSDLPAYANGQRYIRKGGPERERYSDPDASWGHRSAVSTRKGGGFYGYKVHAAACTRTGLPLAWSVETAREVEQTFAAPLLAQLHTRGFRPVTAAMDSAYDVAHVHDAFEDGGCHPVTKLRKTHAVKRGDHKPPTCEHGTWTFAGADFKRGASKWRCPTGECKPASRWVKADRLHPLIPRESKRWGKLYEQRSAVEREFGRLKHEWALLPLRVRGIERVRLHTDLTVLAQLARALSRARAVVAARAECRAAMLAA